MRSGYPWVKNYQSGVLLFCSLFLTLIWTTVAAAGELKLNGIAAYKELSKEYYIGGLFLEDRISNPEDIHHYKKHKQMKLLVTASRWSPRQWQQQWQNNIAINNSLDANDKALQKNLSYFTSFLQHNLKAGDEILIEARPNAGTRIMLNRYVLVESQSDRLFNFLVNTWIGKLPPSREFKSQILTLGRDAKADELFKKLESNILPAARVKIVQSWFSAPEPNAETLAKLEKRQQEQAAKREAKQRKEEQAELKRKQQEKERLARQAKLEQDKLAQIEAAEKAKKEKAAKAKRLARQKAAAEQRAKKLQLAKEKKAKEAQLEQFYYKDLYEWKLRQAIRSEVTYPAWARQFNQEGIVDAEFVTNNAGKVISVQFQDTSASKMLLTEVENAIQKASEKVKPPKELEGGKWEFSVTHTFSLESDAQTEIPSPEIPGHMKGQDSERSLKITSDYMDSIRERILAALKYPAEAVMLKKRGDASIFVTVDAKGNVVKVFERFKAKHDVLTKALEDAVERAKPLPALPAGVGKDTLTIDVDYSFNR